MISNKVISDFDLLALPLAQILSDSLVIIEMVLMV